MTKDVSKNMNEAAKNSQPSKRELPEKFRQIEAANIQRDALKAQR